MFLQNVSIKAVRYYVEIVLSYTAYETLRLQRFAHTVQLVTKFTEGVNNQTCRIEQRVIILPGIITGPIS